MREHEDGGPAPGRALVEGGEPVAGSISRTAAALLFDAAPSGVRLDPGLARCLRRVATGAATLTGRRERVRTGAAIAFAAELAVTRAAQGRGGRTDGLFADGRDDDRGPGDELAEAVLLAARQTAEEWRVRHLGYLLAEVAVSPDLDAGVLARGLAVGTALTGRQLVVLAAVGRRERIPLPMQPLPEEPPAWRAWGALEDVTDLRGRGLLDPPPAAARPGAAARPRLRAADLRLTRRGVLVHRLLALEFVREDAVVATLADLGLPRS